MKSDLEAELDPDPDMNQILTSNESDPDPGIDQILTSKNIRIVP